jgi:hypothetical protein
MENRFQMSYKRSLVILHWGVTILNLREILVRPVRPFEEQRYQGLMQGHHFLGFLPKIS